MDDARGLFLGMPHGTTPAAMATNKIILISALISLLKVSNLDLFFALPVFEAFA